MNREGREKKTGIRLVQGRRGEAYSSNERNGGVSIRRCGSQEGKAGKSGADRPLVEEVTIGVDDVRL